MRPTVYEMGVAAGAVGTLSRGLADGSGCMKAPPKQPRGGENLRQPEATREDCRGGVLERQKCAGVDVVCCCRWGRSVVKCAERRAGAAGCTSGLVLLLSCG